MATSAEKHLLLFWCILHSVAAMSIILISIYHIYRTLTLSRLQKQLGMGRLAVLQMIAIFFFGCHSGYDAVTNILFYTESLPLTDDWCFIYAYIRTVTYELGKFSLYFVWITQIHTSYRSSAYQYSTRFVIAPMYILDLVFLALWAGFLNFYLFESHYEEGIGCVIEYELTTFMVCFLFEAFFCVSTLTLFIRPLCHIINHTDTKSADIVHVIVKKIILVFFVVASSSICVTFEFFGYPLVPVDDVINAVCILLMLSLHRKLYTRLCSGTEKVFGWYWYQHHEATLALKRLQSFSCESHVSPPSPSASTSPSV